MGVSPNIAVEFCTKGHDAQMVRPKTMASQVEKLVEDSCSWIRNDMVMFRDVHGRFSSQAKKSLLDIKDCNSWLFLKIRKHGPKQIVQILQQTPIIYNYMRSHTSMVCPTNISI